MFDEIVTEFAQNAIESSGEVEDYILNLEQNGYSEEILRKIKLILHSIKGSAGSYGFATSSSICHKMEDLVSTIAPGNIDPDLIVRLLKFKDILVESFKNMGQDQSLTNEIKQQIEGLNLEKNSIGLSAMVVGTSRSIDMIITKTLKDHGISTTTSRDCYEALGHLINDNFDFLFTSYEMPKFTGDKLIKAYQTLKVRHLARVDFFLADNGVIYLNEINTFPGLTPISMFPKMMENYGVRFQDFLKDTIQSSIKN